jgi:hypothetical protein
MTVWILTREENQYDQYGEYFVAVYANKPTKEQLRKVRVYEHALDWVLDNGGGRKDIEDTWWYLTEMVPE